MNLSTAQLQALKAHIEANVNTVLIGGVPTAINAVPHSSDNAFAIAAWYNLDASPAFNVYRTSVPMSEVMLNGFDWTRVDNLSVGKSRIWEWITNANPQTQTFDPSKPNIRAGINEVWKGTAADLAVRAAVYQHCYRPATNLEKLFATGSGTVPDGDGAGPATLVIEGQIGYQDILNVWGS